MFCREQAARFSPHADALTERDVAVLAIGSGTAAMARDFLETHPVSFPVYCDPKKRTFAAFGMHRRLGLGLRSASFALRALRHGHIQGRLAGDPWQQGGAVLLDEQAKVAWIQQHEVAGEPLNTKRLMAVAQRLVGAASEQPGLPVSGPDGISRC